MLFLCLLFLLFFLPFILFFFYFFFNDTATTEIYTLSLHDALPISDCQRGCCPARIPSPADDPRSEEHTSELQSRENLVCRLLLEKKKKKLIIVKVKKKKNNKIKKIRIKCTN